jgi:hypothetical protein
MPIILCVRRILEIDHEGMFAKRDGACAQILKFLIEDQFVQMIIAPNASYQSLNWKGRPGRPSSSRRVSLTDSFCLDVGLLLLERKDL